MPETDDPREELEQSLNRGSGPTIMRFMAALLAGTTSATGRLLGTQVGGPGGADLGEMAGSVAGGALSSLMSEYSQQDQDRINHLIKTWLQLQADEMKEIGTTLFEVMGRLDLQDEKIIERLESEEYLKLLKKCFRDWSAAESEEKRKLIANLLTAAAGAHITTDDIVRLFVTWIDNYSEGHFAIVRAVYNHDGITRGQIWETVKDPGERPREDSLEADLFKLLVQDLNMGHLIRQHRPRDYNGNFIKQQPRKRGNGNSGYTSAFDDAKQYELTELGKQFVHYTMSDHVTKIAATAL
jgi:hypothetical protein